jgi:hypothetical protein
MMSASRPGNGDGAEAVGGAMAYAGGVGEGAEGGECPRRFGR